MDLEEFEIIPTINPQALKSFSAATTLQYLDAQWYTPKSKHARWMDLLGDYAGTELFVMDGDALLQFVFGDPTLAIGHEEYSFQILHALHALERTLNEFLQRSAEFEIVFWEANRHGTLRTGDSRLTVASLSLARTLMIKHLSTLSIPVHEFESLSDERWLQYEREKKPMFVMTYDGGARKDIEEGPRVERVLTQRVFIFDLLRRGIAVTYLQTCEFYDAKIFSHVYEQRLDPQAKEPFYQNIWEVVTLTRGRLDQELQGQTYHDFRVFPVQAADQRSCLLSLSLSLLSSNSLPELYPELLFVFIIHCIILEEISIYERARHLDALHPGLDHIVLEDFLPDLYLVMSRVVSSTGYFMDVDGRIFACLIQIITSQPGKSVADLVGQSVFARATEIWSKLGASPLDFRNFSARFPAPAPQIALQPNKENLFQILPFDNEVFNRELFNVQIAADIQDDSELPMSNTYLDFGQGILFSDTQHWHNNRNAIVHSKGKASEPVDKWLQRKNLKKDQRFMAMLQRQAGTLTGALGASLQRTVILSVAVKVPVMAKRVTDASQKAGKHRKTPETSKEKLLKKIAEDKQSDQREASLVWWQSQLRSMKKMTYGERIDILNRIKKEEDPFFVEILLYRIHNLLSSWIEAGNRESDSLRDHYTVSIMRTAKEIIDRGKLSSTICGILTSVLTTLGFVDYANSLEPSPEEVVKDKPLSFRFIKLIGSKEDRSRIHHTFMRIKEHPIIWQLRVFGDFVDRSMDSQPDPRVSFHPDAWQRAVLDCIDRNESLLVVAPTSAGKTFISYYAMEKVLRESDNGILVYVAPTKALVNQIAAEVYARFSKDLNGRSCWAIHTRDYRVHDPQQCQILITVPEMLSIMLLSPPLARVWTPRIRRVILDEIHSIGLESGTVWESILLFAPCPIIGLSATIGQPEVFNKWLATVQKTHGFKHNFISHPHRYSHLRKFYYSLHSTPRSSFVGLDSHESSQRAIFLHPIAMLSFSPRSMPPDLALEAADTITLYHALVACGSISESDVKRLEPSNFFSDIKSRFLRQADIVDYELDLKKVLTSLMASSDLYDLQSALAKVICALQDPQIAQVPPTQLNTQPTRENFRQNLTHLVADLHVQGDLPAILFNFNRTECEIMAKDLIENLQQSEAMWRANDPAWNRRIKQWEQWKLRAKDRERMAQREKKFKDDASEPTTTKEKSWESSFDPEDPSPQFSFAGFNKSYSKDDLNEDLGWWKLDQWMIDGLRRGIAVHHAGMNKRYRSVVESLFRQGIVRVVIATGTLALGINAPAKTSVFCGDSPYLTALMYRQCAGRAGRRGYDLLGKVVFYGLAMDRVQRLILSRLPPLGGGSFPLTSTMCLRLLNLLEGSDYADVAVSSVRSIMRLPQISVGSRVGREQLLHHLRFSIDYLRRARLLDKQGRPLNLFGVATHLYYTEPSNFALVALFRNGILHRICAQTSIEDAKRDFIMLLSHLFGRRYLPLSYASDQNVKALIQKSPSRVILSPLPDDARKVLMEHDEDVLHVYSAYALAYASQYASQLGPDCELPLSKKSFAGDPTAEDSPFRRHLRKTAIHVVARSPFVANSGHGDDFGSAKELVRTVRRGLHLNENAIPSLEHIIKPAMPVNAYLFDFYIHGQVKALSAANGIRRGDVWYLLEEFTLVLKTIRESLEQLLLKASREGEDINEEAERDDSGYGTLEPSEAEEATEATAFKRPERVRDLDWRVYEVVEGATRVFEEKFRAMWA